MIQSATLPESNLNKDEQQALKRLKNDQNIVIHVLPADKKKLFISQSIQQSLPNMLGTPCLLSLFLIMVATGISFQNEIFLPKLITKIARYNCCRLHSIPMLQKDVLLSFLTRGYAKRRNGFLLGLRYANVSLAHSGVESS